MDDIRTWIIPERETPDRWSGPPHESEGVIYSRDEMLRAEWSWGWRETDRGWFFESLIAVWDNKG
jgi:hypothetical protein